MAAILSNGTEWFEQIVNAPSTCVWNLVKTGQEVSEKKMFQDYMILYMYITPWWKILIVNKRFYYSNHT